MFSSIKIRLIGCFLALFFLALSGLGFFLYHELRNMVVDSVDSHLHSEVQLIAGLLKSEGGKLEMELTEAEVGDYALPLSGHYYQVVSGDGRVLARSPSLARVDARLPVMKISKSSDPTGTFYTTITGPRKLPLRMLTETFTLKGDVVVLVQASESLVDSYELLGFFKKTILILFPGVFIITGIGMFLIVSYSLRPVVALSGKIKNITEKNLSERVGEDTADELRPLARNFNTMLGRLEESFARQKQFFSDASHELRTPTTVIKSACDVTLRKERSEGEYVEALEKISGQAGRLSSLINSILEVSRLEGKACVLTLSELDLKEVLGDVVKMIGPAADLRGISIDVTGECGKVSGDRERLTEAFTNLVDNAVKYNKEHGRVDIEIATSRRPNSYSAVVTIADTGVGMTPDEQGRVFERFFRADKSRTDVSGSGLGMAIVKAIVDAHDGDVEVSSEVGTGTTFTVTLSLA